MINLQPYFFFSKSEHHICFRIFGYGLNFINREKQPAPYSVLRSGKVKQLMVYKSWHMMILKPVSGECVGRP